MKILTWLLEVLLLCVFNAPTPAEENKFETQMRCMRTKIPIKWNERGIQIIQQRSLGIFIVPYEMLKWLCWLEFLITWCYRLRYPTDEGIGRNILRLESQSEYNNQKHRTAIYVLPFQRQDVEPFPAFGSTRNYLFDFLKRPNVFKLSVEPAHTMSKESSPFFVYPSFFIVHSSGLDLTWTFFIRNGLDFTSNFFIWNGLDFTAHFLFETGKNLPRSPSVAQGVRRWAAF